MISLCSHGLSSLAAGWGKWPAVANNVKGQMCGLLWPSLFLLMCESRARLPLSDSVYPSVSGRLKIHVLCLIHAWVSLYIRHRGVVCRKPLSLNTPSDDYCVWLVRTSSPLAAATPKLNGCYCRLTPSLPRPPLRPQPRESSGASVSPRVTLCCSFVSLNGPP